MTASPSPPLITYGYLVCTAVTVTRHGQTNNECHRPRPRRRPRLSSRESSNERATRRLHGVDVVHLGPVPQLEWLTLEDDPVPAVVHEGADVGVAVAVGGVEHVLVVLAKQAKRGRLVQPVEQGLGSKFEVYRYAPSSQQLKV